MTTGTPSGLPPPSPSKSTWGPPQTSYSLPFPAQSIIDAQTEWLKIYKSVLGNAGMPEAELQEKALTQALNSLSEEAAAVQALQERAANM